MAFYDLSVYKHMKIVSAKSALKKFNFGMFGKKRNQRKIQRLVIHPEFDIKSTGFPNLALLQLEKQIEFKHTAGLQSYFPQDHIKAIFFQNPFFHMAYFEKIFKVQLISKQLCTEHTE